MIFEVDTRIGHAAREAATAVLAAALQGGRLDLAEYERRLVVMQAARVQRRPDAGHRRPARPLVRAALDCGSPQRSGKAALVRLAEALTDGRLEAAEYADAEELLHRAVTYADVDAVVGNLDARASLAERDQAIERIEAAAADGLLDPAERHDRVAAARSATTDAQLAALVADLATGPVHVLDAGLERRPGSRRRAAAGRRGGGVPRRDRVRERVRAVYAARLRDELARLVADLPEPASPGRRRRRRRLTQARHRKPTVRAARSPLRCLGTSRRHGSRLLLAVAGCLGLARRGLRP